MSKLPRTRAALGLTLLAATALGAVALGSAGPAPTRMPAGEHTVVRAGGDPDVNNTGSSFVRPGQKM